MSTFKKFLSLTVFSSALFVMGGGAIAAYNQYEYARICTSPANTWPLVCFYTEANYKGKVLCEAGERTVNELKYPWKNNIESIKLIDGAFVRIYNQTNRNGDDDIIEKNIRNLEDNFNNKVRSYRTGAPAKKEATCIDSDF